MSPSLQIADQNHFLPTVLTENVCPKPESTTLKKKKKKLKSCLQIPQAKMKSSDKYPGHLMQAEKVCQTRNTPGNVRTQP